MFLLYKKYIILNCAFGGRMEKLVVKANAKINLTLDVIGKREDGYHLLDMVMHSVGI